MTKTVRNLFSLAVASSLLFSCSKDNDPKVEPAEVGITSFGFYKDDNDGVLFEDFVIENISSTETAISIDLPAETDLTALVARFTTTDGDAVKVGATIQQSGTTSNDFTASVEYLVSEKETNKIYTINIGKMAAAVWSTLSTYSENPASDISLRINPLTGVPYIGYISYNSDTSLRRLNLIGYQGSWTRVGAANFSDTRTYTLDLVFNNTGTPYISFIDTPGGVKEASVMAYQSGSWSYVGGGSYSGLKSSLSALSIDSNNNLYGFYLNDVTGSEDRRGVFLKVNEQGSWQDLPINGRSGASRFIVTKQVNDAIYLSVLDFGDLQSVSVYKYENNQWEILADKMKDSPENTISYYNIAMDVDSKGNVYMAYAENTGEGTELQLKVKMYNSETKSWTTLGDMIPTTETRDFDIAVNNYGTPMLLYKNAAENPTFVIFDDEVNNWSSAITLSADIADDLNIEVAPNGVAYASYLVGYDVYLFKYDSPDNQ